MQIIQAAEQHLPQLISLWCRIFGDSREYAEYFFSHWQGRAVFIAAAEDEQIVGMCSMLPLTVYTGAQQKKGYYLYGGCVAPEARGKGIYAEICRAVQEICLREHTAALGIPAGSSLFPYYEAHGYSLIPLYSFDTYSCDPDAEPEAAEVSGLTGEQLSELSARYRETAVPSALYGTDGMQFAVGDVRMCGGFALYIRLCGCDCAVLGYRADNMLHLVTVQAPQPLRPALFQSLMQHFRCTGRRARTAPDRSKPASVGVLFAEDAAAFGSCYFPFDFKIPEEIG